MRINSILLIFIPKEFAWKAKKHARINNTIIKPAICIFNSSFQKPIYP